MPKIRFNEGLASATGGFRAGQVITVPKLTAEMQRWLESQQGRPPVAVLVHEAPEGAGEVAIVPESPGERATRAKRVTTNGGSV